MSFRQFIQKQGFVIFTIEGDGNCLFRALHHQLKLLDRLPKGDERMESEDTGSSLIRQQICNYMREHGEELQNFQETDLPWERYLSNMEKEGTFGGYLELFVASRLYNIVIVVYQHGMPITRLDANDQKEGESDEKPTIYLAYHNNMHYNSLIPQTPILVNKVD